MHLGFIGKMDKTTTIKKQILDLTREYYHEMHREEALFEEGKSFVKYGGRFYDDAELVNLVDASLDFWLTSGPWTRKFEVKLSQWLGVKHCAVCNSGSSANLLAFYALTSPKLGDRAIQKGDEVITVAAAFPTTVNPIIQFGAIPVFVDVALPGFNIDVNQLEAAYSSRTKAVMIAHSLGNPFNIENVLAFCKKHRLWLIEDNCDALGSEYTINGITKKTGTWGDIGTSSFYPPHHITMGEGGAVYTNDSMLDKIVRSFRDWGRDCWCTSGVDNTCKQRYTGQFGDLPQGYDHKYVYSHFGFNLKATDMQAAIGCAQLEKLDNIIAARKKNHHTLYDGLKGIPGLILPEAEHMSNPSWFGFLIAVKEDAGFSRNELTAYLESMKIQTRNLFAGNLIKHPAFDEIRQNNDGYRVIGDLKNTDFIMNNGFWIGVYPGMTKEMLNWMIKCIKDFCSSHAS